MTDCNKCKYISCTEREQHDIKDLSGINPMHICLKYNKRVLHKVGAARSRNHSSCLYPCEECIKESDKKNEEMER